ncbi:recombination-associated protein RdgC [Achromobacter spanius]
MWFKNLKIYRFSAAWALFGDDQEAALARQAFQPGNNLEMQSIGWVPPRENGGLAHVVNGQILLSLRAEKKLLPATVINQVARFRAQEIEEQQGYKPGKKQMKEIKERVTDELLPRAFSIYRDTRVWIDPINSWLVIDTATSSKADEVIGILSKCVDPFPLENLYVAQSPAAAMTGWLAEDEAPANFTIDQDTELRSSGESGAAVRYVKHSIDAGDARRHIQSGKQCTRLAMTWAERISFVLTEGLDIKRLSPLDVLKEGNETVAANDDEKFDSDMVLMTGELAKLMAELVDALGGEKRI